MPKIQNLEIDRISIALAIGNSRYHWAWFLNTKFQSSWDTDYLTIEAISHLRSGDLPTNNSLVVFPINLHQAIDRQQIPLDQIQIYLISVVPSETTIWQKFPHVTQLTLSDIPLLDLYPSLGIDRALALFGAGETYGYPALVIDGGTALTVTGVNGNKQLIGGAIMPGLRLQLQSLSIGTAALPEIILPDRLPPRWSNNTVEAIASGILHTIIAGTIDFIRDWDRLYPDSMVIFTGGDGDKIAQYLQNDLTNRAIIDRNLLFHGCSKLSFFKTLP